MKCSDVYRHICDNLDQRLGTRRCKEIKRHLGACPDCRAYLASLKATVRMYRSLPSPLHERGARTADQGAPRERMSPRGGARAGKALPATADVTPHLPQDCARRLFLYPYAK